MGPFDVVRLVHQFPDGSEHIVGENRLKSEYEESGRYGLERDEEGEDVILTLTNTGKWYLLDFNPYSPGLFNINLIPQVCQKKSYFMSVPGA